jgi:hypothetical protein
MSVEVPDCDAPDGGVYMGPGGTFICRCIICPRCGHHTGNNTQGHFWTWCKVVKNLGQVAVPHFCCPDDCELAEAVNSPPVATADLQQLLTKMQEDAA